MMKTHIGLMFLAALAILALAGCGGVLAPPPTETPVPPTPTPTPEPTATPTPTPAPTATPTPEPTAVEGTQEAAAPYLDPCTLVTQEEATEITGTMLESNPMGAVIGACVYTTEEMTTSLAVVAAQGDEAITRLQLAGALLITDEQDQAAFQAFLTQAAAMAPVDLVTQVGTTILPEAGFTSEALAFGDASYWLWEPTTRTGFVLLADGETYLLIAASGFDEATVRPGIEALVPTALERLPETFTTVPSQ